MKLVIVESPSKCKKIESYLGTDYKCIASFGHIRELDIKKGLKCIDIENGFKPLFKNSFSKQKQITTLRENIKKANEVILATDDDREGEAIAWHICILFNLDIHTTKRIIFHEITKSAIQKAIQNPTIINMTKVDAQLCRQTIDLLLGFTMTPLLWKYISHNTGTNKNNPLSAGRCQTPALRLVYDREKEIEETPIQMEYKIIGLFDIIYDTRTSYENEILSSIQFVLNNSFTNTEDVLEWLNREKLYSGKHVFSSTKQPKQLCSVAPKPFTTSSLQQNASNILHFSPKKTMTCAQKLYENGLITYMRTDTPKYSNIFIEETVNYITHNYGEEYIKKNIDSISLQSTKTNDTNDTNTNDTAQNAHEAIRPTNINICTISETKKLCKASVSLYNLIWKHTIQSIMSNTIYKQLRCNISSNDEKYTYNYTVNNVVFDGWNIIDESFKEKQERNDLIYNILSRQILQYKSIPELKIYSNITIKNQKQHYTEASLVKKLETLGIGRPSTFATIIDKIQDRNYVLKTDIQGKNIDVIEYELLHGNINKNKIEKQIGNEKNKLLLMPIGKDVIEFFMKYDFCELFNYSYTSMMEKQLDELEAIKNKNSNICRSEMCDVFYNELQENVIKINETEKINNIKQNSTKLTDRHHHTYTYSKARYGPILRPCVGDKRTVYPLKPNITLEYLIQYNGSWDIQEVCKQKDVFDLGIYKKKQATIKKGKYGWFLSYGEKKDIINISLQTICNKQTTIDQIKKMDKNVFYTIIDNHFDSLLKNCDISGNIDRNISKYSSNTSNIVRFLTPDLSIRKGKFGNYIFYMSNNMKKPRFFNCKQYYGDLLTDDTQDVVEWIKETYM